MKFAGSREHRPSYRNLAPATMPSADSVIRLDTFVAMIALADAVAVDPVVLHLLLRKWGLLEVKGHGVAV